MPTVQISVMVIRLPDDLVAEKGDYMVVYPDERVIIMDEDQATVMGFAQGPLPEGAGEFMPRAARQRGPRGPYKKRGTGQATGPKAPVKPRMPRQRRAIWEAPEGPSDPPMTHASPLTDEKPEVARAGGSNGPTRRLVFKDTRGHSQSIAMGQFKVLQEVYSWNEPRSIGALNDSGVATHLAKDGYLQKNPDHTWEVTPKGRDVMRVVGRWPGLLGQPGPTEAEELLTEPPTPTGPQSPEQHV